MGKMFQSEYDKENLPNQKPGYYKEYHQGMSPEALKELTRISRYDLTEVEQKQSAIELCLRYGVYHEVPFEEKYGNYEYYDKGNGKDFYLKDGSRKHFKLCNTKWGLLAI